MAGSVVGFLTGASGLLMAEASLLGVLALGFGEGLVGSIVTQKLLNEDGEIDWGVAIAEAGFSAVTAGFTWKERRGVRGVGSEALEGGSGASNGLVKDGLGKISGKEYTVTQSGVDNIKNYLTEQGFIGDYENQAMLNRLENALSSGQKITGADAVFYTHELKEAQLVASGIEQTVAHEAALQYYEVSPFSVYHPDVIQMEPGWWNNAWYDFWGIER